MATITPRLDHRRPTAPPKKKPERFWSPKKWKLYLLAIWVAATAFWVPIAAERSHMGYVMDVYGMYWHYEKAVQRGHNKSYARRGYRKAEANLATADQYIISFTLTGLVLPLLLLGSGAWLLRNAK